MNMLAPTALRGLAAAFLAALLTTACDSRQKGQQAFVDQRYAGARLLGEQIKSALSGSGPLLLVSRDDAPEVLDQIEKGLLDGLAPTKPAIIRVQDRPEDPTAYMRPTIQNTGLAEQLKAHPDAVAVVTLCRLLEAAKPSGANWPPFYALDWSILHLPSHRAEFANGLYQGGVFQKAAPQVADPKADWQSKAAAAYEALTAAQAAVYR